DYSRGESRLDLVEIDLAGYFATVKEFHRPAFDAAGIDFATDNSDSACIRLDQHRFRRVVDNILNNAREALKPGCRVAIAWKVHSSAIRVQIADNGPGIPEAIRSTLFEPFVTSNKEGGTGLGLAIARKIIEDHGGTIAAHSESGVGTTFVIELPASLAVSSQPSLLTV
ncbi:MAG: HAMP domain-containing sensor histidine kinase, partial [Candidatus Zixiibacteriota bacterium]